MKKKETRAVLERFVAALNDRDFDALEALVSPDVRRHSRATPGLSVTSWIELRAFLEQDFTTFPDARQTVLMTVAEDDHVAARVRLSGTQEGPFGPLPPSGRSVETEFLTILRIADGRIAEMWVEWDNLNILGQLGADPLG